MHSLFTTLTQVSVTLLALIFASTFAYIVFLNDRAAQLEEQVLERQHNIRSLTQELRSSWPWSLSTLVPSDFEQRLKTTSALGETDAVKRVFFGCMSSSQDLAALVRDLEQPSDSRNPYWEGRLFFWALTESVEIIGWGGSRPHPQGAQVFPEELVSLGFEQWRERYEKLRPMVKIAIVQAPAFMDDFESYTKERGIPSLAPYYRESLRDLESAIDQVDAELRAIDVKILLANSYQPTARLDLKWLLILTGVTILLGVILPLIVVIASPPINWIGALAVLLLALVPPIGALGILARDMTQSRTASIVDYLAGRWARPAVKEIERQIEHIESGHQVEWTYFSDAKTELETHMPNSPVVANLSRYIVAAQRYNRAIEELDELVATAVENDSFLKTAATDASCGGGSFTSLKIGDPEFVEEVVRRAQSDEDRCVILTANSQYWSRDIVRLSYGEMISAPEQMTASLSRLSESTRSSDQMVELKVSQSSLRENMVALRGCPNRS